MIITQIIIIIISILWTLALIKVFILSWRMIPLRKYRGRLPGQLCLVMVHIILLGLVWIQNFGYYIPVKIFFLFWGMAIVFFLLWFLGFRIIERRDLDRKLKWLIKKHKQS